MTNYQKVFKTFVFQKEQTHQSTIQWQQLQLRGQLVNLSEMISRHFSLKQSKGSIYDHNTNTFVSFKKIGAQNGIFHRNVLQPSFIFIRYRTQHSLVLNQDSSSNFEMDSDRKDSRSKERTVAEAILLVKKWRNLHLNCNKPNNPKKKINLQQAAKMLAVSKKSLDDYYCQLRLAEMYDFDFAHCWNQKMGFLRTYVKQSKQQEEKKMVKPHRHPKHLKIIDNLQFLAKIQQEMKTDNRQNNEQDEVKEEQVQERQVQKVQVGQTGNQQMKTINHLENEFYRGFSFLFDDPIDPFLNLNKDQCQSIQEDDNQNICFF